MTTPLERIKKQRAAAAAASSAGESAPAAGEKKRRGSGDIVKQTVRLRREDWQKMMRIKTEQGMPAQEQFMRALSMYFAKEGLEPPESPRAG